MTVATWIDQVLLKNESTKLASLKAQLRSQIAQLDREQQVRGGELACLENLIDQAATQRRDALAELATLAAQRQTTAAEVAALTQRRDQLAAELADLAEQQQAAEQAVASLKQAQAAAEQALSQQQQALEQAQAVAQAAADTAAAIALEPPQAALTAIAAELAALTQRRDQLAAEINTEIAKANDEIEQARRDFTHHTQQVELALDRDKFEAEKAAGDLTAAAAERWREYWQGPLAADLAEAEAEIGRLTKALEAKQGKPITWQLDEIRALLVRKLDDGSLRPNHLRIAGESESGKSHLVNQLITDGLAALELSVDIEVFDPYPSDTHWRVAPTIAIDPAAVAARLGELKAECESSSRLPRQRPLLVVVDEIDALIVEFKAHVTDSLKVLLKRGRHCGIILWMLGQNGNVKSLAPMDWSDLKNAGAIYLNQVAFDYAKNGLAGRASGSVVGELEAVSARAAYYAAIHPKGAARPYITAVPKTLFSQPAATSQPASQPAAEVPTGMLCPACNSSRTKFNGRTDGKRRRSCNQCGKSWTVK